MSKCNLFKLLLVVLISAFLLICLTKNIPGLLPVLADFDRLRDFILSLGNMSTAFYVLLQAFQILIPGIPSEIVQTVGGYVFGTYWGTVLSTVGTLLGSLTAFFSARLIGKPFIRKYVSNSIFEKMELLLSSNKSVLAIFLIYLIPGLPKDTMNYIAGVTPIKPGTFFLTSTLGKLPVILATVYMGAHLQEKNYKLVVIALVVMTVLFAAGFILKNILFPPSKTKAFKQQ